VKIERFRRHYIVAFVAMLVAPAFSAEEPETLHEAAKKKDKALVAKLLAEGVDVNATDRDKRTPLHLACLYKDKAVVVLLLNNGADPSVP
jgi:ankyrin repeat protein